MDHKSLLSSLNLDCKGFKQLLDSQSLVDCTIACDGGKISAHKVVLSACSSYLASILLESPVEHPVIILPELNIEDVKTLIHYMYTGELLKPTNNTHSTRLLRTAYILSVNCLNDFLIPNSTDNDSLNNTTSLITSTNRGTIDNLPINATIDNNLSNTNEGENGDNDEEDDHNNNNFHHYFGSSNATNVNNGSKSEFQFKCPVCQNDFQTICSFEYHMQRVHNVTSFGCEICHKPFASLRYVLTDHMRRCHGWKAEQKLRC